MPVDSDVQFDTESRVHMALAVRNLQQSLAFYRVLFAQEPTKIRPGYAKFEVALPPVNLALNEVGGATGPNNPVAHFGIQVKSTEAVRQMTNRLQAAELPTSVEEHVSCCYAVQNKVWVSDPDRNKWEVYVVLDNSPDSRLSVPGACCSAPSGIPEPAGLDGVPAAGLAPFSLDSHTED